ncbi:MAG: hypothetical protein Rubg2KO_36780 [Rubricoccaceae bacterium]
MSDLSTSRVLRGVRAEPYTFAALNAPEVPVDERPPMPPNPAPSQEALEEAYVRGRDDGLRERQDEVAALQEETVRLAQNLKEGIEDQKAFVQHTAERLSAQWTDAIRAIEPTLAAMAIDVAEAVLEAPLADRQREATDRAIAEAIDTLAGDSPLSVIVHPVTLLHLQETGLAESLSGAHPRLRWEPDNTIAEDDWAASTPEAAIRRIRDAMIADLRERLGLESQA